MASMTYKFEMGEFTSSYVNDLRIRQNAHSIGASASSATYIANNEQIATS